MLQIHGMKLHKTTYKKYKTTKREIQSMGYTAHPLSGTFWIKFVQRTTAVGII